MVTRAHTTRAPNLAEPKFACLVLWLAFDGMQHRATVATTWIILAQQWRDWYQRAIGINTTPWFEVQSAHRKCMMEMLLELLLVNIVYCTPLRLVPDGISNLCSDTAHFQNIGCQETALIPWQQYIPISRGIR